MKSRTSRIFLPLAGFIFLIFTTCASSPRDYTPAKAAFQDDVVRITLDNGLQVVVVKDPLAPVVTQQITYFVGSKDAPQGFPGMAHAQEHMMFRGSSGLSGDQLSRISALLGGDMNAYTTEDVTSYYFTVPSSDIDLTLKLEALRMADVNNTEEDWQKERGAIEQEVARDNSDPLYVLETRAQAVVFAGTPYDHSALGTKESFDATTAAMLKKFHDSWYAPNNALLVVTGDVDPAKTVEKIRSLYGPIPRKTLPKRSRIQANAVHAQTFSSTTDQPYGVVAFVFRMPGYRSADYPAARLAAKVLDARRGALTELAYEGKTLNSGFSYQAFTEAGYAYAWAAFPAGTDPKRVEAELRAAVEKEKAGVASDLIQAERKRTVLATAQQGNSISGLARSWTNAIALEGVSSPSASADRLESVSDASVQRQIKTLLDFNQAITLELSPSSSPTPKAASGGSFGSPESFGAPSSEEVKLPDWAEAVLSRLPDPKPQFHPTDFTLANGLRLIVQPLAGSRSVSLFGGIHTKEPLQAPEGKEGVEDLMNILLEWGPADMSRDGWQAAMDRIGAQYSVGTDFSLSVLPEDFDRGLALLADGLLNPAFPQSAFDSQRDLRERDTAGQESSPVYRFRRTLGEALVPPGDPSIRRPTSASIRSITLADLRRYYGQVFRPDETTIVVMGAVDPEKIRKTIEQYFSSWDGVGPKTNLRYAPVPPSSPKELFVSDPLRIQNLVIMAETLPLTYDDPDHYALSLGNEFLGGSSFASPLYRELRVKRGLVYSVASIASFSKTRGFFYIQFGAYPEKTAEAQQLAVEQLKRMAEVPMTEAELRQAQSSQLRQIELSNQSVGDVAHGWIAYSEEGLPLDRLYQEASAYQAIDAEAIRRAFSKYVDPARLSTVTLGKPTDGNPEGSTH